MAVMFWVICMCIGYLTSGTTGAVAGLLIALCVSMFASVVVQSGI